MKVAITSMGPSLDAALDPRFGRCSYFALVETDDMSFEAVENPNMLLGGGAGIQSAQFVATKDVKFVLTGNCGPNAYKTLSAADITVVTGCSGTVADVVGRFKAGKLKSANEPNVESHFGTADPAGTAASRVPSPPPPATTGDEMNPEPVGGQGGRGGGRGMGGGRGPGGGGGRGPGGGRGRGPGGGRGRGK